MAAAADGKTDHFRFGDSSQTNCGGGALGSSERRCQSLPTLPSWWACACSSASLLASLCLTQCEKSALASSERLGLCKCSGQQGQIRREQASFAHTPTRTWATEMPGVAGSQTAWRKRPLILTDLTTLDCLLKACLPQECVKQVCL